MGGKIQNPSERCGEPLITAVPTIRITYFWKYLCQLDWPRCMLKVYMTYMYRELTCTHVTFVLSLIFARSMA